MLLLDEPFGALDARVRKDLRDWLRRLHDEVHVTTIFVTHDQEEAMEVAEQIVVMNDGAIEQVGEPRDLYEHPANEFVMSFVGPVNRLGDELVRPHDIELMLEPNGSTEEAMIERIVHLGFEVRVEFTLPDGDQAWSQLTREEADQLELERGPDRVRPQGRRARLQRRSDPALKKCCSRLLRFSGPGRGRAEPLDMKGLPKRVPDGLTKPDSQGVFRPRPIVIVSYPLSTPAAYPNSQPSST